MVKFLPSLLLSAVILIGCSNDGSQDSPEEAAAKQVTIADTSAGTIVETSKLSVDSIRLKLDSGTTFRYKVTQFSEVTQDTAVATTNSTHYYSKKVKSKRSDGSFDVSMKFDSLKLDISMRNIKTGESMTAGSFNSRDSTQLNDPKNVQFSSVIGEEVTLILGATAKIQEISGVSSVVNKIAAKVPGAFQNEQQRSQAAEYIEGMMYASFVGQEFVPYPAGKLDSSLSWTNEQSSPVGKLYTVSSTTTYRIVNVRLVKGHRLATVEATLKGFITPLEPPKEMGISISIEKSEILGSSHAVLDLDNGTTVVKKNHLMLNVKATVTNRANGQKQTISQKNESRYDVELIP